MMRTGAATRNFVDVLSLLAEPEKLSAYCLAWNKPMLFYVEHHAEEAVRILLKESEVEK